MVDPNDPTLAWRSIDRYLQRHGIPSGDPVPYPPSAEHPDGWWPTTGGQHASNSVHPTGRARDLSAARGVNVEAAMALLIPLAVGNTEGGIIHLHQLFYSPMNIFVQDGQRVPDDKLEAPSPLNPHGQNLFAIHLSHIHVALAPGVSLDDLP